MSQREDNKSKFPKLLLFILSMAPFFIILGLMTMDIPISFNQDAEFIGYGHLWNNIRVGVFIIVISAILELGIMLLFRKVSEQESGEETEIVEDLEDINFELVSFVTSMFLPLISFQYNQLSHWLATGLILILIGYIFCNSDGFYTNPTLAIFRYRLYYVKLGNQRQGVEYTNRKITVLSRTVLRKGDKVRCVKLTDKISCINIVPNTK